MGIADEQKVWGGGGGAPARPGGGAPQVARHHNHKLNKQSMIDKI